MRAYGANPESANAAGPRLLVHVGVRAKAAHQSVLDFRGVADNSARPAALPLGQISAATGCASRPGETSESRREKLVSVRKEYPRSWLTATTLRSSKRCTRRTIRTCRWHASPTPWGSC